MSKFTRPPGGPTGELGCQRVAQASEGYVLYLTAGQAGQTSPLAWAKPGMDLKTVRRDTEGSGSEVQTEFLLEGVPVLYSLLLF